MTQPPKTLDIKSLSPFMDPLFMNTAPAVFSVGEDGVSICYPSGNKKTKYQLITPLPAGTRVRLEVFRSGVAATLQSEVDELQKNLKNEREAKAKVLKNALERASQEAVRAAAEFNATLNIPFIWCTDIKVVMSGMQAGSNGNGVNRRSVQHVRVLEDYSEGRFKRKKGDFLCGPDHSVHQGYTDHAWTAEAKSQVTCKQCINVAKRFSRSTNC